MLIDLIDRQKSTVRIERKVREGRKKGREMSIM